MLEAAAAEAWQTVQAEIAQSQANDSGIWQPHPDNRPQCAAYQSDAFEILYGGAAGGGKSDLLLGLARTAHTRSLLLRRTYPDLERSLISRSLEFYGDSKQYNASKHVWNIGKRRIEFGHMETIGTPSNPKDEAQYASAPYDLIEFDQLEQFPQYAYEFMFSRARSADKDQRVRVVSSANPIGEGVTWIMQRWRPWLDETYPKPAKSGEIRWFKRDEYGNDVETTADDPDGVSRTFISAGLKDNPFLGDDYRRVLNLLPEPLRSALMSGDWNAAIQDDAYQVIPRAWIKAAMERWIDEAPDKSAQKFSACDVARGGDDATVISRRIGAWYAPLERHPGITTPDGQSVAALIADEHPCGLDVIGVGASAYDIASETRSDVIPINFAMKSTARDKSDQLSFVNKRAEYHWKFREALDPANDVKLMLPNDPQLLGDLCAPRWKMQTNGIQIEAKEDIKKRLGRSPDDGDAVVMCNGVENEYGPGIVGW